MLYCEHCSEWWDVGRCGRREGGGGKWWRGMGGLGVCLSDERHFVMG